MARILVTEEIADRGLDLLREAGHDVDVRLGLSPDELRAAIAGADALIIRSATDVDADLLEAADSLLVVGRAGIGLDNVDVATATRRGVMVVNAFYENVARHKVEHRELASDEQEENVVLELRPRHAHDMLVACLWSHWQGEGAPDLLSFAAITDDPPPEIAAAGHDRCIIPIKPEHLDAWLNPDPSNLAALYAILDDRDRPYYEHRLAA